jgi:hypothetical protein
MSVAVMTQFSADEIACILRLCGKSLADAYQVTLDKELWYRSTMALQASEYLIYEIQKQQQDDWIH